jgi:transcription initiation factor TFIIA large subunit
MSNTVLGSIYSQIIEEVINNSRGDFEDSGIDESVLDSLREVWQSKLTHLNVASFPWDPAPQPDPAKDEAPSGPPLPASSAAPQPAPATAPAYSQAHMTPVLPPQGLQLPTLPGVNGTQIKTEPGLDGPHIKQEQSDRQSEAASRAAENLKSQYGSRASGSIQAIHRGQPGKPPTPVPGQPTGLPIFQPSLPNAQTDGNADDDGRDKDDEDEDEDDWEGVLMQKDADGNVHELGRVEIDRLLHERMASRAKAMEGGGLMLPLKEATKHKTARSRRERQRGPGQFDGEEDEDAINSDLDDPEDDADEDDADEEGVLSHIMLCMYDKVQRVKNKWKCTLKDGVLTVNGKEYVFHKATGEYEW